MYQTIAYPHISCKFSEGYTKVLHVQNLHLVNDLIILSTGMLFALHQFAALFEVIVKISYIFLSGHNQP